MGFHYRRTRETNRQLSDLTAGLGNASRRPKFLAREAQLTQALVKPEPDPPEILTFGTKKRTDLKVFLAGNPVMHLVW